MVIHMTTMGTICNANDITQGKHKMTQAKTIEYHGEPHDICTLAVEEIKPFLRNGRHLLEVIGTIKKGSRTSYLMGHMSIKDTSGERLKLVMSGEEYDKGFVRRIAM
jgi:hypothetical protein